MSETKRDKLVVVDGNSLLYRAFFALPNLTTSDGRHTNAVYGFSMMLLRLLEEEKPEYCVVAFDAPGPTFRHEAYSEYKATRQKAPDELRPQGPLARKVCRALRIPILEVPGVEADDVVGTVARCAEREGVDVIIVTGDLDALQLVTERVRVLTTRRGITDTVLYGPEAVQERYGLQPEQIPDLKALAGDTSDNIPGVRGVGEKTAVKLLQRYGTVEAILQGRDDVPEPRVRAALEAAGEQPRESHALATIRTDVELDAGLADWRCQEPDRRKVRDLFGELEFRSLRKKFEEEGEGSVSAIEALPLATPADLERLVTRARARRGLALALPATGDRGRGKTAGGKDSEDSGLGQDVRPLPELSRLGLCVDDGAYVWDAGRSQVTLEMLRPVLEDVRVPKCAHDLKALLVACWQAGIDLGGAEFDPMVADYLLNPARSSHALPDVTFDHLGYELPGDDAEASLATRAAATYSLWPILQERLREENLDGLNRDMEVPLISVLARMELEGIAVDVGYLRVLAARLNEEAQALEQEIHELAGMEFNIGSTKQLQFVLFDKLGLPPEKKTKTGYSTGVDVLESLSRIHPIAGKILAYRELTKLRSTYAEALPRLADPATGRVHTSLNQAVAATGRLSSSEPNLQNIPIRTQVGREIRRAFVAPPGTILMSADYSQIELRLLAHVTGDEEMVRAFNADEDIHVTTASALFGVPESEVTSDMRRRAKTVNFAVIYGMSEFGLARDLGVPTATAREWIANYFGRYPGVLEYKEEIIARAQRDGYVTTLMGRRRYLPEITSRNRNFREFAERAAVNTPIQGTAADIIKMAMVQIDALLRGMAPPSPPKVGGAWGGGALRMILQVHDELLFEGPPEEAERLVPRIREVMEGVLPLRVHLKVDVKAGPNWADMEECGVRSAKCGVRTDAAAPVGADEGAGDPGSPAEEEGGQQAFEF